MVERIKVSYRNGAYYVDRPNWGGGDVVPASDHAELEAEVERQSSDIAEFMRRLGPRWFLEQNWFPPSVDARRALEAQGGER